MQVESVVDVAPKPEPVSTSLSETQVKLIQRTWSSMESLGAEKAGVLLFLNIFEAAPGLAKLFSFGRVRGFDPKGDLSRNAALVAHARSVVCTMSRAVSMLDDMPKLAMLLYDLGEIHARFGVKEEHYPIVGAAFLKTLETGLGNKYTPEVRAAYVCMWEVIVQSMLEVKADSDNGK
mmetsp:Transcript_36541/g.66967  ORF Transcript_36541/g.66967 Transcript_36541/m.66967 type:complete len:177 (+) Transcript_36541:63-593(+)